MERITLDDSAMSAAIKLVEGNPGAITAIMKLMEASPKIDPDSAFGSLSPLFALDTLGIYGPEIWMLWKDVCGYDPVKVETLFRAHQLGIIRDHVIFDAIRNGKKPDFDGLLEKVRIELPNFAAESTVAQSGQAA